MEPKPFEAITAKFRTIRTAEEERAFGELVSRGFGVAPPRSFFDDFPVWRQESGAKIRRIGAYEGTKLVAAAAARFVDIRLGAVRVPISVIGCVVTAPEFQGQGLASRAVTELLVEASASGAAIAVLFGSQAGLYARLGFEYVGNQERIALDALSLPRAAFLPEASRGWRPELFTCLQERTGGLLLGSGDAKWISRHLNAEWFHAGARAKPDAYACVGKGIDLPGIIHEWGGRPEVLRGLLSRLREERGGLQIIGSPAHLRAAGLQSVDSLSEPLCMAKVLRPELGEAVIESPDFWLWGLDGA